MKRADIDKISAEMNAQPIEDFDNLSSNDMHQLLYGLFSEESVVQFRAGIDDKSLVQVGFLGLIEFILTKCAEEGPQKLTKWGNLSTALVTEIFHKGFTNEDVLVLKERKIYKQDDMMSVQSAMIILNRLTKLTKARKQKLSLTKLGSKMIEKGQRVALFQMLFMAHGQEFSWAYHDAFPESPALQNSLGYILFLLLRYGDEERDVAFYAEKIDKAFPMIKGEFGGRWSTAEEEMRACLYTRCFERFLEWFDFVSVRQERGEVGLDKKYVKNKLIGSFLFLDASKFKFSKSAFRA